MTAPTPRGLTFGPVAERYERYRPGYPPEVVDAVLGASTPRTAVEIGAGTGKATRAFAARGIAITAVEPDPQMAEVLVRATRGLRVQVVRSTLEALAPRPPVDLLYAAAAWHWTDPATRWARAAALLVEGGVFAAIGGPTDVADEDLADRLEDVRREYLGDDTIPGIDHTEGELRWPGNELVASAYFTDVEQLDLPFTYPLPADDLVGLIGTVSAVLQTPEPTRRDYLARVRDLLPDPVDVRRQVGLHRAVRTDLPVT